MRNAKRFLQIVLIAVSLFILWQALEPFSPRFQGRTAKQWLAFYSGTRRLPERAVVDYFGESVVPMLVKESRPSGFYNLTLNLDGRIRSAFLETIHSNEFDRRLACNDWARVLMDVRPSVFENAIAEEPNISRGLELTRLFFGDRQLSPTLKKYSQQRTNSVLQARAEQLLDAYRALN